MNITNMHHFLDNKGNIPKQMPREKRELGSFFALIIDATTKEISSDMKITGVRCFEKGCSGMIRSEVYGKNSEIRWKCSKCMNEGKIIGWHMTKWDNRTPFELQLAEKDIFVK